MPGIQISENFPECAKVMHDAAIIRSMTSKEGSHPRATYLMHTGYLPTASVKYPAFGSIVAQQLPAAELELPAFVRIGQNSRDGGGGGLLGVEYDPFADARGRQAADQRRADHRRHALRSPRSACWAGWTPATPPAAAGRKWPSIRSCIKRRRG